MFAGFLRVELLNRDELGRTEATKHLPGAGLRWWVHEGCTYSIPRCNRAS
jgi:hypothetical protein